MKKDNLQKIKIDEKKEKDIHELIEKIDKDPHNTNNYLELSTYLIEENSIDQALELLQKAQKLVDDPKDLTYNIAICYYMNGDFEKSLSLINTLENTDETLYQKSLIFQKLGQYQKALAYALTIKEQDDRVLELLGDIWLSLGDLKTAHDTFKKINSKNRNAKVNFMLGVTLFDTNPKQARNYIDLADRQDPNYVKQAKKQFSSIAQLLRGKNDSN